MSGSGSNGQSQNQTTETKPWAGAQPYMIGAYREAQRLYNQGAGTMPYRGPLAAPQDPAQLQSQQMVLDYARSPNTFARMQGALNANQRELQAFDPAQNQYLATANVAQPGLRNYFEKGTFGPADLQQNPLVQQMTRDFNENTMRQLRNRAIAGGGAGGSRQALQEAVLGSRASADMAAAYQQQEAQRAALMSQFTGSAYDNAASRVANAASNYGTIMGMPLQVAQAVAAVGDARQAQRQAEIDAIREAYEGSQTAKWDNLGRVLQVLSQGNYSATTAPGVPRPRSSKLVGALGGAAGGAALGAKVGSAYPGVGTAIGAVVGGVGGYLSS